MPDFDPFRLLAALDLVEAAGLGDEADELRRLGAERGATAMPAPSMLTVLRRDPALVSSYWKDGRGMTGGLVSLGDDAVVVEVDGVRFRIPIPPPGRGTYNVID